MIDSDTPKDLYSLPTIFFKSLISLGFPIQFKEGAVSESGVLIEDHYRVMVDSIETRKKITDIYREIFKYNSPHLIYLVDIGDSNHIMKLIEGKEVEFLKGEELQMVKISNDALRNLFVRAYQRYIQKGGIPTDEEKKLFEKLEKERIKPVEPKHLQQMMTVVIRKVLEAPSKP